MYKRTGRLIFSKYRLCRTNSSPSTNSVPKMKLLLFVVVVVVVEIITVYSSTVGRF